MNAARRVRRKVRAQRRNQERQTANAVASQAEVVSLEPRRYVRHAEMLDFLLGRRAISLPQYRAGDRLKRDWLTAGQNSGLVSAYEFHPGGGAGGVTEVQRTAMVEYQLAMKALGTRLAAVVHFVCVENGSPGAWALRLGKREADGSPVLREALDALVEHYQTREQGESRAG